MTDREIAKAIRLKFPRFDPSLYAKTKRPDQYGIELIREAQEEEERVMRENGLKSHRKRTRKERDDLPKLTIRVPRSEYNELQRIKKDHGIKTDNLIINKAIELAISIWKER